MALLGLSDARSATVTWDGGGGNSSWQTAANWSGNTLPGVNDDVVIDIVGTATITSGANVTIRSLQCSNHFSLSGGTFRVGGGSSVVQGQFSTTGTPMLSATGAVTEFRVVGPVSANAASFEALGGAKVSLPNLTSYVRGFVCFDGVWQVSGAGSVLDFPGLTNFAGGTCAGIEVRTLSGGKLLFTNLTTISDGAVSFLADGVNSLLDLPVLQTSLAASRSVEFEARNAGNISMPLFKGGPTVAVTLQPGATLPVAQFQQLSVITVSGLTVEFTSLTNFNDGSFNLSAGAAVSAPNLMTYGKGTSCAGDRWVVNGTNTSLSLPALTNITGGTCVPLEVWALNGGIMRLTNVTTIADGHIEFLADGTNSLVDLGKLQQVSATFRAVSFEARTGGAVWIPMVVGGPTVSVTLASGGTLPVAQLQALAGITVGGMNVAFPALTNFDAGRITITEGAVVSAPNLVAYNRGNACVGAVWTVNGAGSVLDLPGLVSLRGGTCVPLEVKAASGGIVLLTNLPALQEGLIAFTADGAGSVIDLRALEESFGTSRAQVFEARNNGTIIMPLLPGGATVEVTIKSGGVLPVSQMRTLRAVSVDGLNLNLTALTNFDSGSLTVEGGAVVSAPSLASYTQGTSCAGDSWTVSGAGSLLNFPGLVSLTGGTCVPLTVRAQGGGIVLLTNIVSVGNGLVDVLADGADSLVDLRKLAESQATTRAVKFEIRNGGDIAIPLLPGGPTVEVSLQGGGTMPVAQMHVLFGITVSGRTEHFPALTNFDSGSFAISNAAVVSAPALAAYRRGDNCAPVTWNVSGSNSVLNLPGLVSLTGGFCTPPEVRALNGGAVLLTNLASVAEGRLAFLAEGTNSLVDLRALQPSHATAYPVAFEARNGGTVQVPLLTGGPTVEVALKAGGILPVAQMGRLSGITVSDMAVAFPGLTNFDTGYFSVSNAAPVTAPNVLTYAGGDACGPRAWLVSGAGSLVDLAGLSLMTGKNCEVLTLKAFAGGDLLLGTLTNILGGNVAVVSDGAGSLVDLHSLNNFLNANGQSSLNATNGGVILLSGQPFFLSGVTASLPAGSPGFPPLSLTSSNHLVLFGEPWRSYWVESRNTTSPTNPWTFYRRVPLTNDFQAITRRAAANVEFRTWEFVADPYLLDLDRAGTNVQLVLYAPANRTLDVQSATNLTPVINWQTFATVTMTNTFRIFPPEPATAPQRYFRAQTQ